MVLDFTPYYHVIPRRVRNANFTYMEILEPFIILGTVKGRHFVFSAHNRHNKH